MNIGIKCMQFSYILFFIISPVPTKTSELLYKQYAIMAAVSWWTPHTELSYI